MQEILDVIVQRKSTRAPFDPKRSIAKDDLLKVLEAARWSPTAHNMQNFEIIVVDDKKLLGAISKIKSPTSKVFVKENYQNLSFSKEELLQKKVGILGNGFPPDWLTSKAKLTGETGEKRAGPLGRFIDTGPILLVVVYDPRKRAPASEGDFLGIMSLGCVLENMLLMACALGMSVHILSSISNEAVEKEVKKLLKIPKHLRIAISLRLGYSASGSDRYLRVRRDIDDLVHHNRFGQRGMD